MKYILKLLFVVALILLNIKALAQIKFNPNAKRITIPEDSLLREIDNTIYYTYYSPNYRKNNTTYTILKVDINWDGKVTGVNMSDSADPVFTEAWVNRKSGHDDIATLERYAKIKGYKNLSLLIPINYQYGNPVQQKELSKGERDALMKFNKQNFTGPAVMLNTVKISVLGKWDM